MFVQYLRDEEVVVLPRSNVEPEKTTTNGTSDLEAMLVTPFDDEELFSLMLFSATNNLASLFVMKSQSESCMFR